MTSKTRCLNVQASANSGRGLVKTFGLVIGLLPAFSLAEPALTDAQIAAIIVQATRDAYYRTGQAPSLVWLRAHSNRPIPYRSHLAHSIRSTPSLPIRSP